MEETKLYGELVKHLDQGVMGSPSSPALMEILKITFPVEEAEIAIELPMQNKTLPELQELFPEKGDLLEEILNRMVKRGTVFTSQRLGKARKYRLLPSALGWSETPFWAGKSTDDTRKLAPLWLKYREEAFGEEFVRGGIPNLRVLPISKTLRDSINVLPFDELRPKVEEQSFCAVAHCPCRLIKQSVGEGCHHTIENCLVFGTMGRYLVEQGMAREITKEETMKILKASHEEGLVHSVDNIEDQTGVICNCCGCCCGSLNTKKKMGIPAISPSNYVASVDGDLCAGCGTCEERCPMDAIVVGDDNIAEVNEELCIGCGVCTPTCPEEAVDLTLRAEIKPPPQLSEFLAKKYKEA